MTRRPTRFVRALAMIAVAAIASTGCKKKAAPEDGTEATASASAAPPELPPLAFKEDTPNALLTWVDEAGNFHVVEKVADVPEANRERVRVVLADNPAGTGDVIYVADLRSKAADGSYPVRAMRRTEWEEIGASKRKARLEALAPSNTPPPSPAPSGSALPTGVVAATIYGASWCGPCHQAEALLKSLGVKVTMKDIEESATARQEMETKLKRIRRQGGSIPIIDVMGQIFVGFSEGALRAAVTRARGGATL